MKKKALISLILAGLMLVCLFACTQNGSGNDMSGDSQNSSSTQPLTQYSITYELNGGTATNPATYTEADEFYLSNPSKEGYSFVGWTYDNKTDPELSVKIAKGTTGNKTFVAHYEVYDFEPLKVAVFADIQLTTGDKQAGSIANAVLALKDHFKYAKSVGADVIFMSGDIINNAIEGYYQLYDSILKEVYGEDESKYPEFVMNMGNHEWWDAQEHETAEAVAMFKRYARIQSPNLVKESAVPYYLDETSTLPTYYKVIKGVPFLAISADKSNGEIGDALKAELTQWLKEIAELESVRKGGPIFVSYHYPIPGVTYKGEHTDPVCTTIDELLKDYPSAIVFTGDTHFNGVNERTINQVDYTSINIGSSSYSRSISESATGYVFDNVNKGSGKSSAGTMKGDVAFKFEYTPTIMIADISSSEKMTIDRYYTADDLADVKKVGITWEFPNVTDKNHFVYTEDRTENTDWANKLYGKNGLTWNSGEVVRYNVEGNKMMVSFNDVTDHNCAEHYRIRVQYGSKESDAVYYDYMSPYYRYDEAAHSYNYVLENIPVAASYTVSVTAYDFFDNPSLTSLTATAADDTLVFPEMIDVKSMDTYCDISRVTNYEVTAEGSVSSVEYYYRGTKRYPSGMILNRLILENSDATLKNYLSVTDWSDATLSFKVKNPNNFDLYFGLTLVTKEGGTERWITDGGSEVRVIVPANSDWTTVKWNFAKQFGITSNIISNLGLKVSVPSNVVDVNNGYELSFYVDDLDITSDSSVIPHEFKFENTLGEDFYGQNIFSANLDKVLSFEYKLVTPAENADESTFAFIIYNGKDWSNYVNYITVNPYANTSSQDYVAITELSDGWYNVKINLSNAAIAGDNDTVADYSLSHIYAPKGRVNCVIYLDSFKVESQPRHQIAYGNRSGDPTKSNVFTATPTDKIKFYYKAETYSDNASDSRFAFMIFDGTDWNNWLGYVEINVYSNTSSSDAVTITADGDGWYEVVVDLSKLQVGEGEKDDIVEKTLSAIYFRPDMQTCNVSFSEFTKA